MLSDASGEKTAVVMVVDDEDIIRNMVNEFLKIVGYKVVLAADGFEAIDKIQQFGDEVNLVILDMVLPGISGIDVLREFLQINPEIKVIMTSGYDSEAVGDEFRQNNVSFLQKPFRIDELMKKIEEMIAT